MPARVPHAPTSRWLVAVGSITLLLALAGLDARATYGARVSGDEPQYLLTALSLGHDASLDISDELAGQAYLPFHEIPIDPQTRPLDETGREVSPHDPLLPAILALPTTLGGWAAAKATLALLAAATAVLTTWVAIARCGVPPPIAALTVTGAFGAIPLATYGTQVYPELPAGLAATGAVAILTAPTVGRRHGWGLLVAIVALPWLSVKYVPVAAVLGLWGVVRSQHDRRALATFVAGLGAMGVLYLALHRLWYGGWTVYAAGDHFADTGEFAVVGTGADPVGRTRRVVGLLFDRDFGLVGWTPLWVLLPVAVGVALRTAGADGRHRWLLAVVAAGWANATWVALTMHGWWVPGRQIVVVLPVAAVLLAIAIHRLGLSAGAVAALAVPGLVQWLWLAIEASTGRRTLIVDFADSGAPLRRLVAPLLPDGVRASATDDLLLAAWAVVAVALVVVGVRRTTRTVPPARGRSADADDASHAAVPDAR